MMSCHIISYQIRAYHDKIYRNMSHHNIIIRWSYEKVTQSFLGNNEVGLMQTCHAAWRRLAQVAQSVVRQKKSMFSIPNMSFFAGQGPPGSQRVGKLSTKRTDNTMCHGMSRGHQTSLLASSFPSHVGEEKKPFFWRLQSWKPRE